MNLTKLRIVAENARLITGPSVVNDTFAAAFTPGIALNLIDRIQALEKAQRDWREGVQLLRRAVDV